MEPEEDKFADFTVGLIDGLTVPIAVATGMVAGGASRHIVILAIVAEMTAGSISMGLSTYLSIDSLSYRRNFAWKSGIRTMVGYLVGALIPLFAYVHNQDVKLGFYYSIVYNVIALFIFGVIRSRYTERLYKSIAQVMAIGLITMALTYFVAYKTDGIEPQ